MTTESTLRQVYDTFTQNEWDTSFLESLRMQMSSGDLGGNPTGNAGGAGDGGQGQGSGTPANEGEPEYSPYASDFLGRVPAEHRDFLTPYVKQWDAGVTRRFQGLQSELQPWQELGTDYETAQTALAIWQEMQDNPWAIYGLLQQSLMQQGGGQMPPQMQQQGAPGQVPPPVGQGGQQFQPPPGQQQDQGSPGVPPEVVQRLDRFESALTQLAQHLMGQQQQSQQSAEEENLNTWLEGLHEEFGEFDDNWFLMQVYQSGNTDNPEQHIKAWNDMLNQRATQQTQVNSGLPILLGSGSGGGSAPLPSNSGTVQGLSAKDRKDLVARSMAAANAAKNG